MTTAALGTFTCSCEESTVYSSPLASGIFDRLLAATQFIKMVSRVKCKFSILHMQSSIFWSLHSGFSKSWPFLLLVVVTYVWKNNDAHNLNRRKHTAPQVLTDEIVGESNRQKSEGALLCGLDYLLLFKFFFFYEYIISFFYV